MTDAHPSSAPTITMLLERAQFGQGDAWDRIYSLLYDDLHRIARSQLRQAGRGPANRVSPTSLVSETWLRLAHLELSVENRQHLISLLARTMRFVLTDEARRAVAEKRGEGMEPLPLEAAMEVGEEMSLEQLVALDTALNQLSALDPRLGQLVELSYFGGLTGQEIAEILQITERTVRRDWRRAQAFLLKSLGD